jgi:hypothetical protein
LKGYNMVWWLLDANGVNPYWGEIEYYHNFSRKRLYALLEEHGFRPAEYHVSERYRVCMEVIALVGEGRAGRIREVPSFDEPPEPQDKAQAYRCRTIHSDVNRSP